ncbi:hypothetical protein VKT23_020539 [Stygiomarasmius scandens]|uniref:Uncharacterized protein n=1 Tax=Marasmiellus scandens TaxID=2682957 RepID=A0ABR1ILA5_9AGAR
MSKTYGRTSPDSIFPIQISALCNGIMEGGVFMDTVNSSDSNTQYHDFRVNKADYRPNWYFGQMVKREEYG